MVYLCNVLCNVLSTRFLKSCDYSLFWFWLFHTPLLQGHFRLAISFRLSSDTRLQRPNLMGFPLSAHSVPNVVNWLPCLLDSGARAMWSSLPAAACATAEMLLMLPPGWFGEATASMPCNRRSKNPSTGVELPHSDRYWYWSAFLIQGWSWS